MCFFLMSKGSVNPKIRFLCQKVCSIATHTDTTVNTEDTLSGFQEFFLQPIVKDRSISFINTNQDTYTIHAITHTQIHIHQHLSFIPINQSFQKHTSTSYHQHPIIDIHLHTSAFIRIYQHLSISTNIFEHPSPSINRNTPYLYPYQSTTARIPLIGQYCYVTVYLYEQL